MIRNHRGASTIGMLFWAVVLFAVIHVGVKWLIVHFDAWRMEDEIKIKASLGQVLKDDEIRYSLEKRAQELELPLKMENFAIQRDPVKNVIVISTAWIDEVHYFWGFCGEYCIYTYKFEPRAEASLVEKK